MLAADGAAGAAGVGTTVRFANGISIDAALRLTDAYARVVTGHYRAEVRSVPFKSKVRSPRLPADAISLPRPTRTLTPHPSPSFGLPDPQPEEARRQINQWIESATAGRIKDLLPQGSISSVTQAVLTNALYFKGAWLRPFDARFTQHAAFYLTTGGHVRVPFMSRARDQYVARRPGYKVLKLPYANAPGAGGQHRIFSMYIYLPDDYYGLPGLLHTLSSNPALLESSRTMSSRVPVGTFMVPKFTISCKTDATKMLRVLGLNLPFDPVHADLSEMVEPPPEPPLVVSEIHHTCFVEVNEEGT
ncbi:Serpin-Z1 [Dichanthelium oligosanthes]|uniref:Serpin-Z1 n=1 Tax=Dichanthelium oligosanthes TaxID=888268 RepID=A0A1E5W4U4_9POAL|nr:Serpin-Z1 [Dichanthelium oligosanthes]